MAMDAGLTTVIRPARKCPFRPRKRRRRCWRQRWRIAGVSWTYFGPSRVSSSRSAFHNHHCRPRRWKAHGNSPCSSGSCLRSHLSSRLRAVRARGSRSARDGRHAWRIKLRQGSKLSTGRFILEQWKVHAGLIEQVVVKRPDSRLCTIARADFPQDRFHMRLDGRLCDPEEPRYLLVGIAPNNALKDSDLPCGKLHRLWFVGDVPWYVATEGRRRPLFGPRLNF